MSAVNVFEGFPMGILLFPALYAAVKIAAGVLVLHFGKQYIKKKMGEKEL